MSDLPHGITQSFRFLVGQLGGVEARASTDVATAAVVEGLVGSALSVALFAHLHDRGLLSREEAIAIMERAIAAVDWVAEGPRVPGIPEARERLEQMLIGWRRGA